eukprot:UN03159
MSALRSQDDDFHCTPPIGFEYMKTEGPLPRWVKGRSCYDAKGCKMGFEGLIECPYKVAAGYFCTWSQNRLTVYSDNVYDGQMRPTYTFYNIKTVPLKSQVDVFSKHVEKEGFITSSDWVGNDECVQLLIGDKSGFIFQCDIQQRLCINKILAFKGQGIKQIRSEYKSNIFAVLSENNDIAVYQVKDCISQDEPPLLAKISLKENIIDMFWHDEKLYCMTENSVLFIESTKKIMKNKKGKLLQLKSSVHISIKGRNKFVRVIAYSDYILIQRNDGVITEYDMAKKKAVHNVKSDMLTIGKPFSLDPLKRVLVTGDSNGNGYIIDYKTGDTLQDIRKRGNGTGDVKGIFWSKHFKQVVIMAFGSRCARFQVEYDRLVHTKVAYESAFYSTKLPFSYLRPDSMDQTNIDHDHRAYQWHWGTEADDSTPNPGKKVQKSGDMAMKPKIVRTIMKKDSQYNQIIEGCKAN